MTFFNYIVKLNIKFGNVSIVVKLCSLTKTYRQVEVRNGFVTDCLKIHGPEESKPCIKELEDYICIRWRDNGWKERGDEVCVLFLF